MKRTLREALQQIVINLSTPGLLSAPGNCRYRGKDNGKPCIVASLLPETLIATIVDKGCNGDRIDEVMSNLGDDLFLDSLGGMTRSQASAIQDVFDGDSSGHRPGDPQLLRDQVQAVLDDGDGMIGVARCADFDLR